jgi:orotate phosphoribosyltransferase
MHDGRPSRPHALLTSGLHSDGFVNCTFVTQRPELVRRIVSEPDGLAASFPREVGQASSLSDGQDARPTLKADWVIGSAFGAITLADGEGMKLARFEVAPGEKVLVVEDTLSTGGSTLKTIAALRQAGVADSDILPCIICLVNRSGFTALSGRQIRALITTNIHTWPADSCPLCKAGSAAVRPKAHWKELTEK